MPPLQRRHWTDPEKALVAGYIMSGVLQENTHPDSVPPELLKQLTGRSAESVRQYVKKHYAELVAMTLAADEFIDQLVDVPTEPPKPKRKRVEKKLVAATPATPPPELVPPLPRAITFGAKRATLDSWGACGPTLISGGSTFDDINKKLGMHRDARTENWDGMPRFM